MTVISHNCPSCSAALTFDIDTQDWTCDYCKRCFTIEDLKKYISKKEFISGYDCENCGAAIITYEDELSTICAYCGSPAIIRGKLTGAYKPDFIVPFKHTKEDVVKSLLSQTKPLSPHSFLNNQNIKSISGVYLPYWLCSCEAEATIEGKCYDRLNRKIAFKRKAEMVIERIPADAKTKLNDEYLRGIEPFKYDKLKEFEYSYLAGFNAERYDLNSEQIFEEQIKERIFATTISKMKLEDGIFYDENTTESETLLKNYKMEQVLMPIWCIHMEYMGRKYIYYINDQNLIIAGKYPVSIIKTLVLSGLLLLAFVLISFLAAMGVFIEVIGMLAIFVAYAVCSLISSIRSYHTIHKNTTNVEYVKPKSFKFIEYKDEFCDLQGISKK